MHPQHANTDFSQFSESEFDEICGIIKNQLTANAADFPDLIVTMITFGTHLTTYRTIADSDIYPEKTADLRAARLVLENDLKLNGVYVNQVAAGNLVLLEKSGYPISKLHEPVGALAKGGFKKVTSIPGGFEIELVKVEHAVAYIICVMITDELAIDGTRGVVNLMGTWPWFSTTKTKLTIKNLKFSKKYSLAVVAIGTDPTLTFSDVIERTTQ
jgi:hypothetical protein